MINPELHIECCATTSFEKTHNSKTLRYRHCSLVQSIMGVRIHCESLFQQSLSSFYWCILNIYSLASQCGSYNPLCFQGQYLKAVNPMQAKNLNRTTIQISYIVGLSVGWEDSLLNLPNYLPSGIVNCGTPSPPSFC